MAKKHRNRKHRSPHRTATRRPHGAAPIAGGSPHLSQDPLLSPLREALRDPDPIAFWGAATSIVVLVDEPGDLTASLPEGVDLLQTVIDVDLVETTALLHMVAALSKDELTRARARRAVRERHQPVPPHVSGLAATMVTATRVFGDLAGDNHMLELTLPGQVRVTLVIYVERAPRLYLKDAFFVGERLDVVQERFVQLMAADGVGMDDAVRDLEPAQSRAALEQALAGVRPGTMKEPEQADQWPMCRPIVELVLSRLPEGGSGYDEHGILVGQDASRLLTGPDLDWDDEESLWDDEDDALWDDEDDALWPEDEPPWVDEDGTDLVEEFLGSPHARDITRDELTPLLASLLMSLAVIAEDDPLHWCPETVRWSLEDALPASPLMSAPAMDQLGRMLPALVSWAHEETGADPETTAMVLEQMSPLLTDLPRRWATREMAVARLDALTELATLIDDPVAVRQALLAQQVGGREALQGLGTDPLPAEPLVLDGVPEDLHGRLVEVDAALVAGISSVHADQLPRPEPDLDEEFLTACRRLLVQAAAGDPDALRGRAGARTTAAAVAWIVGRGNRLVGSPAPVRTGELTRAFGVRSAPSQRAERLQRAAVLPHVREGVALGSPDLLVASARRAIIHERDRLTADEET